MSEGLNKHKEELLDGLTERVVEQLTPVLNEWFEKFEENFVTQYAETFQSYFEDSMRCYVAERDEELRVHFVKKEEK